MVRHHPASSAPLSHRNGRMSSPLRVAMLTGLLVVASACGKKNAGGNTAENDAETPETSASTAVDLQERPQTLEMLRARYARRGTTVRQQSTYNLAPRNIRNFPMEDYAGDCLDIVALSSGEDIDLALFGPDGQLIARDDTPDAYPLIINACLPEEGIGTLVVRSRAASATRASLMILSLPQADRTSGTSDEASGERTRLRRLVEESGFPAMQPFSGVQSWTLYENERVTFPMLLRAGNCYAIAARSLDESLVDLDITIENQSGERMALEAATDARPVLAPWCPEGTDIYHIGFRAYEGGGSFAWQVMERSANERTFELPAPSAEGPDAGDSAQP